MQRGDFRGRGRGGEGRGGFRGQDRGGQGRGGFRGGDRGGGPFVPRGGDRGGPFVPRGGDRGGPPPFRGGFRGGPPERGGGFRGGDRGRGRGGPTGPIIFTPDTQSDVNPTLISEGDQLVKNFGALKVTDDDDLPLRPGYGKEGKAIKVRANHFKLVKFSKAPMYEYKIYFQPEVKIKRVRKRLLQILEDVPEFQPYKNQVAHDWSEKLVAAKKLPSPNGGPLDVTVRLFDEDEANPSEDAKAYTISFSLVNEISSDTLQSYLDGSLRSYNIAPLLSALNIVFAKYPSGLGQGTKVGRDRFFFKSEVNSLDLGAGLEAWKGFYSSVRPTLNSLLVNVNVCYTAFYKEQNLAFAMEEFRGASYGASADKFVEGVRVRLSHLSYRPKKTVRKVSARGATQVRFQCAELGGTVTVADYFQRKYNIQLRKPDLLVDLGTKEKSNLVPAELCDILPAQSFKGRLSDNHTAAMIRYACNPPADNARSIVREGLSSLGLAGTANQSLNAFGIGVSPEMVVIPARLLDPPQLIYAQNKTADLNKDRASWNLQSRKFLKGQRLANWGVFIISASQYDFSGPNDPELAMLIAEFQKSCGISGMTIGNPSIIRGANVANALQDSNRLHEVLSQALRGASTASFLLVILSNGDKRVYATIRRICDIELGIPATCAQSAKIRKERGQLQYMANVALKINAKLGGVNHALDRNSGKWLSNEVTMLVGMDVTHPGPGSIKGTPSIAGVVASYDVDHTLYPASLRLQESKKEMIVELADMMVERLQLFRDKRNRLPERIIVFRDGVSEGQFITVLREEYPKFLQAFTRIAGAGKPYRPKLTMIICGKRHHTRFYPTVGESADHLGNPKPGTVVDRGVTAVYEFDFFLQAHAGLQGQTRPTHYTVVHDENNFGADAAQCLINYASYIFARATKAVSLVPPAYYADLVCERGRFYIHDLLNAASGGSVSGNSGGESDIYKQAERLWGAGIHHNVKSTMFYL
ncbi:Piwi-domain-containing protein [Ramaria rubella]|nr:Piwi-domain-containing protein [Ramaria rubella]